MGGWAPYVSLTGMFISSTNTIYKTVIPQCNVIEDTCWMIKHAVNSFAILTLYILFVTNKIIM